MDNLKDVLQKWQDDIVFRQLWQEDPQKALAEFHIELSPEDLQRAQKISRQMAGEMLNKKISK